MRGITAKKLRFYANFLKTEDAEKFKDISIRRIYQRLKQVYKQDQNFKKFITKAFADF